MEATDFTESSASDHGTAPVDPAVRQAPATEATTFFSLPRELRDLVYYYLCKAEYTQIRVDAYLRNLRLDQVRGGNTSPASQLAVMQASRRLWKEGSRVLYGENLFRFHVGSTMFDITLLTRRTADLMQDIEISLYPSKEPESVRALQLFGNAQILRKSCFIKLQFRKVEFMNNNTMEALKQMTGFGILTFEMDAPYVTSRPYPVSPGSFLGSFPRSRAPIHWVSVLLAFIKTKLTPAMGPGTFANHRHYRRLIFKPQEHKRQETGET